MGYDVPEKVQKWIEHSGHIPSLPEVVSETIRLASDPTSSMETIARVVSNDPPLSARVLRVANSAYYGLSRQVSSLQLALTILGVREIRKIAISIAVISCFDRPPDECSIDRGRFWRHSTACAHVAERLAKELRLDVVEEAFTAGLLHDLGWLVLEQCLPDDVDALVQLAQSKKLPLSELDAKVFRTTHADVGAWVFDRWKFPACLVESVAAHHEPSKTESWRQLACLVRAAEAYVRHIGLHFDCSPLEQTLFETKEWEELLAASPEAEKPMTTGLAETLQAEVEMADAFFSVITSGPIAA